MSLSGLDSAAIASAYNTVTDKGGWFLIQYTARDVVDLLSQGIGGPSEMRDQAIQYYEKNTGPTATPLFGIVQVRRRKVLVKILLETSSRLIKARAQVHWNSISTLLPKHDTTCEISSPEELTDNVLLVNTDLHSGKTAGASGKKVVLDGIRESTEDQRTETKSPTLDVSSPESATIRPKTPTPQAVETPLNSLEVPPKDSQVAPAYNHISSMLLQPGQEPQVDQKPLSNLSLRPADEEPSRRLSSLSSRPDGFDLFGAPLDFSFLDKPKVKLGPRPVDTKRPGSSSRSSTDTRPSAALPTGLRSSRPPSSSARPGSRDSTTSTMTAQTMRIPAPPPIPESSSTDTLQMTRPKSSSGSVKSLPATLPKSSPMSKEKQRLLKFREMYKQNEKKAKKQKKIAETSSSTVIQEEASAADEPSLDVSTTSEAADAEAGVLEVNSTNETAVEPGNADGEVLNLEAVTEGKEPEMPESIDAEAVPLMAPVEEKVAELDTETSLEHAAEVVDETPSSDSGNGHSGRGAQGHGDDTSSSGCVVESSVLPQIAGAALLEPIQIAQDVVSPTSTMESSRPMSIRQISMSDISESTTTDATNISTHEADEDRNGDEQGEDSLDDHDYKLEITDNDITPRAETSATTPTLRSPTFGELTPERTNTREGLIGQGGALPVVETFAPTKRASKRLSLAALRVSIGNGFGLSPSAIENRVSTSTLEPSVDDDLGEELEDAIVEEARRMSVSKSPTLPAQPRTINTIRSVSTPLKVGQQPTSPFEPVTPIAHSFKLHSASGTAQPSPIVIDANGPVAAKKVGGGIAAKIADLQRSFSRSTPASLKTSSPPSTSKQTFVARRAALDSLNGTPTANSQKHTPILISNPYTNSRESISYRDEIPEGFNQSPSHSALAVNRLETVNGTTEFQSHKSAPKKSDAMSVRTAIVRNDKSPFPTYSHGEISSPTTPELNAKSPTMSFHQRAKSAVSQRHSFHPGGRSSSISSFRSSPAEQGSVDAFGIKRQSIDGSWRSFGRIKGQSEVRPPNAAFLPRNPSNTSLDTATSQEGSKTESKKQSRATRLLKRMSSSISSLTAGSRSHLQTLNEKGVPEESISRLDMVRPQGIVVGDLNVQFPDTLLWKRRWVEIDDHGYLVMKPSSATESLHGIVKRYHMTDFQPPFPPDLDRQELPNSIILDMRDGRTLQCACQSPIAQRKMLHLLLEYHMAWLS